MGEKVPAVPGGVRMLEIVLPIRVTAKAYGFNAVYAGKHWTKRPNHSHGESTGDFISVPVVQGRCT